METDDRTEPASSRADPAVPQPRGASAFADLAAPIRAWTAQALGVAPEAIRGARLIGATSSSLYALRIAGARDVTPSHVLRVLDHAPLVRAQPGLASRERTALAAAVAAGLPAPRPVAARDGSAPGDGGDADDPGTDAPLVLMDFVEGRVDLRPRDLERALDALAEVVARLHDAPLPALPPWRSWRRPEATAIPAWTAFPEAWRAALARLEGDPPGAPDVFLHRDVHPTNVLWTDGRVSGLVDWLFACRGPAGVDLAHTRLNLAVLFGPEAADAFLDRYRQRRPGYRHDPYWDADAALGWGWPRPRLYPPWRSFGRTDLDPELLERRIDAHLDRAFGG